MNTKRRLAGECQHNHQSTTASLRFGFWRWNLRRSLALTCSLEGASMVENIKPNEKKPNDKQQGEKAEGKYHYNPGNQSGKEAEIVPKDEAKTTK
jgi:hypothetical protein